MIIATKIRILGAAAVMAVGVLAFAGPAAATVISTSGSANQFGAHSFLFEVTEVGALNATAKLTNTTTAPPVSQIDKFVFNLADPDPVIGSDIFFTSVNPTVWTISIAPGGILFDFVGTDTSTGTPDRLGPGEMLTFDIEVTQDYLDGFGGSSLLDLFTLSETSLGRAFGCGSESGQVGVSFQQLNDGESDCITSNWSENPEFEVPEPATLLLFGIGLLGLGAVTRRRRKLAA